MKPLNTGSMGVTQILRFVVVALVVPVLVVSAACVDETPATTVKPKWYHK